MPTWAPFRLQFYFNGHNALAVKLARQGIAYQLVDNAFIDIADFPRAQVPNSPASSSASVAMA